jgi:hypothetical protein
MSLLPRTTLHSDSEHYVPSLEDRFCYRCVKMSSSESSLAPTLCSTNHRSLNLTTDQVFIVKANKDVVVVLLSQCLLPICDYILRIGPLASPRRSVNCVKFSDFSYTI